MAARGERDGRAEDECASEPGEGAEVLAEELDAEEGAESGLNVEEDAGARGGDAVDAPVPEEGGGGGAGDAAGGERSPGGEADVREGHGFSLMVRERSRERRAEDPEGEHDGSGEDCVCADDGRGVGLEEFLADENPDERGDEGEDDEEIAQERGATGAMRCVVAAENDERGAGGGGEEGEPADGFEPLGGEEGCGDAEQHGHGADHERGMADGGEVKALELNEELDGHAEEGGDEQQCGFTAREAGAMDERDGEHDERGEEEAVKDHPRDGHFIERDAAEEEACTPEAGGEGACAVAEQHGAATRMGGGGHSLLMSHMEGGARAGWNRRE